MVTGVPVLRRSWLTLGILALVAGGCDRQPPPPPAATGPVDQQKPPQPADEDGKETAGNGGTAAGGGTDMQSLEQIARQYEALQGEAERTNRQMVATLSQYQRRGGKLPPNFGPDLTPEQRDLLAFLILNERADTRDLLQDILDKDAQIRDLRVQMQSMRSRLPDHSVAREGDRHDRLALKYLASRGVPREKAEQLVAQVSLHENLLPGFNVWTYYAEGQFGTWVTQGKAAVTPQQQQQRVMRELTDARDAAEQARVALQTQMETVRLEEKKKAEHALEQARNASAETGAAMKLLEEAEAARRRAESTILLVVGSKKQLERQNVIKGKRVVDAGLIEPTSLDISGSAELLLEPGPFELTTVKKITILPEVFVEGRDYQLQKEGSALRVRLLNLERFRRTQAILVIE